LTKSFTGIKECLEQKIEMPSTRKTLYSSVIEIQIPITSVSEKTSQKKTYNNKAILIISRCK
ncbi:MAG TPA: hypothetical protein O0W81_02590, partial [Methanocorpusculum sp.]|nr:hypothetical protein [Methanocorpusculum sp.]